MEKVLFLAAVFGVLNLVGCAALAGGGSSDNGPLEAIKVSANARYVVQADGSPFFWQGDTAWCIYNHAGPADVDAYLHDRKAKGFNVIQGVIANWDYTRYKNPDGELPSSIAISGRST